MDLKFSIPDDKKDLIITAYCVTQGYQEVIADDVTGGLIPNPESKAAFVKRCIINQIKGIVRIYENKLAETAAAHTNVDIT